MSVVAPPVSQQSSRTASQRRLWATWAAAWFGCAALGVVNGAIRQALYADQLGDLRAHQVSTATLLVALAAYFWAVDHARPLPDARTAVGIGVLFAAATVAFEVVFGMYLRPEPLTLAQVMRDYDLTAGRVWIAVPLWMALGPLVARTLHMRSSRRRRQAA